MNYATIKKCDIADGEGVRVSLFVSGCTHHCKGCFQPETWNFDYGEPFDETVEAEVLKALEPEYIAGITLLGGEPMEPENQKALLPFLKRVHRELPDKDVWLYTGYRLEDIAESPLLHYVDVLVDGPFVEAEKDAGLPFRGSRNQRIIQM